MTYFTGGHHIIELLSAHVSKLLEIKSYCNVENLVTNISKCKGSKELVSTQLEKIINHYHTDEQASGNTLQGGNSQSSAIVIE
jgi:flagellar biosynthesis chaperone FliJ